MKSYSSKHRRNLLCCLIALALLACGISAAYGEGFNVGTFGKTYPIAERDFVDELEERGREFDKQNFFTEDKLQKMVEDYRPKDWVRLPKVHEDNVWQSDLTYELEFDIPDISGKIAYPKGYRINPLDYTFDSSVMVFIDGEDMEQLRWFQESPFAEDPNVEVYLTWGSAYQLEQVMKRKLWYATTVITKRLQLRAVPSVVVQRGNMMEVHEYAIDKPASEE